MDSIVSDLYNEDDTQNVTLMNFARHLPVCTCENHTTSSS